MGSLRSAVLRNDAAAQRCAVTDSVVGWMPNQCAARQIVPEYQTEDRNIE
jgi:hypothetical protein